MKEIPHIKALFSVAELKNRGKCDIIVLKKTKKERREANELLLATFKRRKFQKNDVQHSHLLLALHQEES